MFIHICVAFVAYSFTWAMPCPLVILVLLQEQLILAAKPDQKPLSPAHFISTYHVCAKGGCSHFNHALASRSIYYLPSKDLGGHCINSRL